MKTKPIFRTKYDPIKVTKSFKDVKSLTDPQYKEECSIEGIVRKYGVLPRPEVVPLHSDVSEYGDFNSALMRVEAAKSEFMALPSDIRERFGNDPKLFFEFVTNPSNVKELISMGLATERIEEKSTPELLKDINETLKNVVTPTAGGQA